MAKIPQGILGGISGKIGGIVGSSWKGINVIKTKPLSVANPRTAPQLAQRNLFGNTVAFAVQILSVIIKPLWDRFASKQSGFNAFIQANIDHFLTEIPAFGTGFIISKGKIKATPIVSLSFTVGGTKVTFEWDFEPGTGYELDTDVPFVVFINRTKGDVTACEVAGTRADYTVFFNSISINALGDLCDLYLAFRRADGTIVSNTSSKQQLLE